MKIKVFKFEVSNWTTIEVMSTANYQNDIKRLHSESDIETIINDFIHGKTIINIKINNVDTNYHNNGKSNTIHLIYTIMYKEN